MILFFLRFVISPSMGLIMKKLAQLVFATSITFAVACPSAYAGILFTSLGNSQYSVKLDPITFTLKFGSSLADGMIVEDFFTTNATGTGYPIAGNMHWQRNGGETKVFSIVKNSGNAPITQGMVDPNDLIFLYSPDYASAGIPALRAGDKVTVWTDDMIFQTAGLRIAAPGPFTAHLLNHVGSIATADVSIATPLPAVPQPLTPPNVKAVPEPASLGLLGLGFAALFAARRRNRA
jgi:hypothetical protein